MTLLLLLLVIIECAHTIGNALERRIILAVHAALRFQTAFFLCCRTIENYALKMRQIGGHLDVFFANAFEQKF